MGNPKIGSTIPTSPVTLPSEPRHIAMKYQSDSACEEDYFEYSNTTKSVPSHQALLGALTLKFYMAETADEFTHVYRELFSVLFKNSNPLARNDALATLKTFVAETSKEHFTQSMAKLMAAGIALNYPSTIEHRKEIETFIDAHFTEGLEEAGKEVKAMLEMVV